MKRASALPLVFYNGTAVLPDKLLPDAVVVCDGGLITRVSRSRTLPANATLVDARGGYLAPGFVDIHVHGGDGHRLPGARPSRDDRHLPHDHDRFAGAAHCDA